VDVADAENGQQRVLGGLKPGDRIVVDGALLLRREEDKRID
jgi:multidrug efflux pump subunit AcrA (membrane-fusion protein)